MIDAVVLAIIALAAAVRYLSCRTDFWFDELWNWWFAGKCKTVGAIFLAHHDNNHYLNTLWLYALGSNCQDWFVYRLPSLLAGIAAVPLMITIARRAGKNQALLAGTMASLSYILVIYSSEARGYALAIFFSLLCIDQFQRFRQRQSPATNILFCLAAACGLLSHLTFLNVYVPLLIWSVVWAVNTYQWSPSALIKLARLHLIPLALFSVLYVIDVRFMIYGRGPVLPWTQVIGDTIAFSFGIPERSPLIVLVAAVSLAALMCECLWLRREKNDIWIFYLLAVLIMPASTLLFLHPKFFYPRYLVLGVPILFLVYADVGARLLVRPKLRVGVITALCLFVFGNAVLIKQLLVDGRGHYGEALKYMAETSQSQVVTVGSPIDLQGYFACLFYTKRAGISKRIDFVPLSAWPVKPPEWIIESNQDQPTSDCTFIGQDGEYQLPQTLKLPFATYRLSRTFPFSARLSGFNWCLYERQSLSAPGPQP